MEMFGVDNILTNFDSRLFDVLSKSSNRIFFYHADMKNFVSKWSESAVEYFGLPSNVLSPASIWDDKVHPDDMAAYQQSFADMMSGVNPYHNCEYRITNVKGEYVWVNCRGYMTYDENGEPDFFAGYVSNMGTVSKIDSVTGLWTSYGFRNDINYLLEEHKCGAAMQIDIRNFKRINSRYGYDFGDLVLYTVGRIINELCGENEKVYRIDGTQYAVVSENGDKKRLEELHTKLVECLDEISINGVILHMDISCSATVFPQDGQFIDEIRNNLWYALANAKQANQRNIVFYSKEIIEQRNNIIRLTDALRKSVANNFEGFRIVMQPIVDAQTGDLHSAEVLLRWSHEDFPGIGPMDFIPILEQTLDIIPVGKWILDRAFSYIAKWNKMNVHYQLKHVNINFSYIQFKDETLKGYILEKLDEYNLPHDTLVAELTESCRVEYSDKLAELLQGYRNEGIIIALDDFGTGYASLMVLKDIPADIVKIDHTMTRTIVDRPKDRNLIEFIITYCDKMDIDVCTEGVETGETLAIVKSAHAKYIQGYYYDRPLEMDTFFDKYIA